MPALFLGHGSPMNALETNGVTETWRRIGASLPPPRAILSISAHWFVPVLAVTAQEDPPTLHDFGGFPEPLHRFSYPAPGSGMLAERVAELLAPDPVVQDRSWGLDHGTWSILTHLFPAAATPVVQLSLDRRRESPAHLALARRLQPLRDEGVLVLGSGNLVHNLRLYEWNDRGAKPPGWARRFEDQVRRAIDRRDFDAVAAAPFEPSDGPLAVPTPEHFLPLLYVLGLWQDEPLEYPVEGFEGGSISMLGVRVG